MRVLNFLFGKFYPDILPYIPEAGARLRVPHGCTCWNILKFVFVRCVYEHIRACRRITVTTRPYGVFTSIKLRDRRFTLEAEKRSDVSQEIAIYISLSLRTLDLCSVRISARNYYVYVCVFYCIRMWCVLPVTYFPSRSIIHSGVLFFYIYYNFFF